jgi:hypothetical protein
MGRFAVTGDPPSTFSRDALLGIAANFTALGFRSAIGLIQALILFLHGRHPVLKRPKMSSRGESSSAKLARAVFYESRKSRSQTAPKRKFGEVVCDDKDVARLNIALALVMGLAN